LLGNWNTPSDPFSLKGDVFFTPDSRLKTLLSTKSGLGKATIVLMISVISPVQIKSWKRRKPFRKFIPKVIIIITAAKKAEDPIEVIRIMRNVSQ
jgi:hypothetical protein